MIKTLELLDWATNYLGNKGILNPRQNSEILLSHLLGCRRIDLYLHPGFLRSEELKHFFSFLRDRSENKPLQYILKKAEFMGLEFMVIPDVFIPRPETEILVETALKKIDPRSSILDSSKNFKNQNLESSIQNPVILDIGTGCGNIAISLTKFLSNCKVIAIDISEFALEVARTNARLHRVEDKIEFIQCDLFSSISYLKEKTWRTDLIVSNPPYISNKEFEKLPPEVKFESPIALDGGSDGLYCYRRIIDTSPEYLRSGGYLIMEIGYGQSHDIQVITESSDQFEVVETVKDYSGIERVIVVKKKDG